VSKETQQASASFELRVLGPLEVWAAGEKLKLPRSKKTRALLAYLAVTGRPHRRERLCHLLWDVTDDPRGALRWSLSRLRKVFVDSEQPIEADREQVAFRRDAVAVDSERLSRRIRDGLGDAHTEELEALATVPRGAFLEGLDLPDFLDFNAWCIAERESHREQHCLVLSELVGRLRDQPRAALPYAQLLAQTDAFNVSPQVELLRLLVQLGGKDRARQRYDSVRRLYREVGAAGLDDLESAWRGMGKRSARGHGGKTSHDSGLENAAAPTAVQARGARGETRDEDRSPATWPFVGRAEELERLERVLVGSPKGRRAPVALVVGEPGSGKSRLAERFMTRAGSGGFEVLRGRAYEAESSRPYGPWVDALALDLGELAAEAPEDGATSSRDAMFAGVAKRLTDGAGGQPRLLVLDDIQWLDSDSAELLHFVTRSEHESGLAVMLLARGGELNDNQPVMRALRGIRREGSIDEIELGPLALEHIAKLVGNDADVQAIHDASAGNPLYAIELARARATGLGGTPPSVVQLVRERVGQLPDHAGDVLRWGAVLGHAIDVERLEALSSLALDELVDALERLEHSALLRIDATRSRQRYVFSHDVVREAVYGDLSHPRRRRNCSNRAPPTLRWPPRWPITRRSPVKHCWVCRRASWPVASPCGCSPTVTPRPWRAVGWGWSTSSTTKPASRRRSSCCGCNSPRERPTASSPPAGCASSPTERWTWASRPPHGWASRRCHSFAGRAARWPTPTPTSCRPSV
jgi:DNA-binding SARP family transcriptional activator